MEDYLVLLSKLLHHFEGMPFGELTQDQKTLYRALMAEWRNLLNNTEEAA